MKGRFIVPCRLACLTANAAGNAIGTIAMYGVPCVPFRCAFDVLLGLEADASEAGRPIDLGIEVRSPDWELLYYRPVRLRPGTLGDHGEPWVCYRAAAVGFTARSLGDHEIRACAGSSVLAEAGLNVFLQGHPRR